MNLCAMESNWKNREGVPGKMLTHYFCPSSHSLAAYDRKKNVISEA